MPWHRDDGRSLVTLLSINEGPGSDRNRCVWHLGRLDVGHPDVQIAAWRVARKSMELRCGLASAFQIWQEHVYSGAPFSAAELSKVDPFLAYSIGTPLQSAPLDHLEAHIAEILWTLLTHEITTPRRSLIHVEEPSLDVTESGGDGLAVWRLDDGALVFRLWEIKKDTGAGRISTTIYNACQQLDRRASQYIAKYTGVCSRQHEEDDLGPFFGRLSDLWIENDPASGLGLSIATSREKAPVRRSFGSLVSTFPDRASDGRLEGLVVAIADFSEFALLVRSYVWIGH